MKLINKKTREILQFGILYPGHDAMLVVGYFNEETGKWERHSDKSDQFVPLESKIGQEIKNDLKPVAETTPDPEPWKGSKDAEIAKANWDRIVNITVEQLGVNIDQVIPDADFIDDLGADSLDCVELGMAFEEEFGLAIPEEEMNKMRTPRLVARWLNTQKFPFAVPQCGNIAAEFMRI